MTLDEWFDKYFAHEYLNVQDKEAWRASAKAELQEAVQQPTPIPPSAPAPSRRSR